MDQPLLSSCPAAEHSLRAFNHIYNARKLGSLSMRKIAL
jgi:hypothetical protein